MTRWLTRLVVLGVSTLLAFALVAPASAEVEVSNDSYQTPDPRTITFTIRATGDPLASATLDYRVVSPDGNVGGDVQATVTPGATSDLSATLTTNGTSSGTDFYIPVGSVIAYSWTLVAQDGTTTETEEQTFVFLDGRETWQELVEDNVTIYWYDNIADAQEALAATADSIADIEELLQVELDFPVRVIVYPRESEGELAQRSRGSTFDSQIITGGSRVSADVLHIYDGLGSFTDIARHEAAHLVTKVAGDGAFTRIPAWLDEGTAVYAQLDPGGGYRTAVTFAVSTDETLRLRNMNASSNRPDVVNLFYGQSWSTVAYMIDEYGEDAFAEVFRLVKSGRLIDDALTEVYGVDQDGLYNEWRVSQGLSEIEYAPVVQATANPDAAATRAPLALPTSVSSGSGGASGAATSGPSQGSSDSAASEGGGNTTTAIIIIAIALLAAGGLGGLGFKLMKSSK